MSQPIDAVLEKWHEHLRGRLPGGLDELLDDDVVFYSPIVYTPQEGKAITKLYLQAAGQTLPGDSSEPSKTSGDGPGRFRYTKTVTTGDTAVLEFETTVEGKYVNGVDIIRCNDAGRIVEFRVMIRPLQAINLVHAQMKAALERMKPGGALARLGPAVGDREELVAVRQPERHDVEPRRHALDEAPLPDRDGVHAGEPGQELRALEPEAARIACQQVGVEPAHRDAEVVRGLGDQALGIDELEAAPSVFERVELVRVAVHEHGGVGIERGPRVRRRIRARCRRREPSTAGPVPPTSSR